MLKFWRVECPIEVLESRMSHMWCYYQVFRD